MIDYLYKLDYDDHRFAPIISKIDFNSDPPAKVSSKATFNFGNKTDADQDQPKRVNSLSLLINAKVYIIADKYEVQALKDLAIAKYVHVLPETWNSSAFTESADLVYNNTVETDRMLRDAIVQGASKNIKALLDRGEFVDLLKSQSDLAVEVLRVVVSNPDLSPEVEALDDTWGLGGGSKKKKKKGGDFGF
ncbi:hypothetical protein MMC30_008281 [Trapelia coarctata]|nr:hypothetical protein [Trapelia coarctata]